MDHKLSPGESSLKPAYHRSRSPFRVWWREFLASFFVLGIIGAIVGVLVSFQGRPLPDWPHHITINALVSLLIVLAKFLIAFVLAECLGRLKWSWFREARPLSDLVHFERASRGSIWGSLRLLWILRGRSLLACIGALVTIVAIAIDPFTQQLIQYYPCQVESVGRNGSIAVSHSWADTQGYVAHNNPESGAGYGIQGAIMNGFFSPGSTKVPFNCATGNCSFPDPIYTMGYCSSCEDATKDVTFDSDAQLPVTRTVLYTITDSTQTQTALMVQTGSIESEVYRLPSNLTAAPGTVQSRLLRVPSDQARGSWDMNFEVISADDISINTTISNTSETIWEQRGLGAARCTLKPCIYKLNSSVTNGVLSEDVLATVRDITWGFRQIYQLVVTHTACLSADQRSALGSKVGQNNLPEWLAYDPESNNDTSVPRECYYVLDIYSTTSMGVFLSSYLTQTGYNFGRGIGGEAAPQLNALYRAGNTSFDIINSTMTNVTQSISSFFRQQYANTTLGVMHEQTTCVNIQWKWFSFFASISAFSFAVLLSTIAGDWQTGHDFKTDILPMMFGAKGMVEPDQWARKSGSASAMERDVQRKRVRFSFEDDGWAFTEVRSEESEQRTQLISGKE